jgi:hypothetical protein
VRALRTEIRVLPGLMRFQPAGNRMVLRQPARKRHVV